VAYNLTAEPTLQQGKDPSDDSFAVIVLVCVGGGIGLGSILMAFVLAVCFCYRRGARRQDPTAKLKLSMADGDVSVDAAHGKPDEPQGIINCTSPVAAKTKNKTSASPVAAIQMNGSQKTDHRRVEVRAPPQARPRRPTDIRVAQTVALQLGPHAPLNTAELDMRRERSPRRLFENCNFLKWYDSTKPSEDVAELLSATKQIVSDFANRHGVSEADWTNFYNQLYQETVNDTKVFKKSGNKSTSELKKKGWYRNLVSKCAEYLWTSGKCILLATYLGHDMDGQKEFCSILNEAIRIDDAVTTAHVALFARSLNILRVDRTTTANDMQRNFPRKGKCWRGTGFDMAHQSFFAVGIKYRVPGFLATSSNIRVAKTFVGRLPAGVPRVIWIIVMDPRGRTDPAYRVKHMTLVRKAHIKNEDEYLFTPYSTFTVLAADWSADPGEVSLRPALDNKLQDEALPLAPWY